MTKHSDIYYFAMNFCGGLGRALIIELTLMHGRDILEYVVFSFDGFFVKFLVQKLFG